VVVVALPGDIPRKEKRVQVPPTIFHQGLCQDKIPISEVPHDMMACGFGEQFTLEMCKLRIFFSQ
jgi:hypothetical protein